VGVPKAGDNEYVGWETEFKAKAGVYHLIATVAGAKSEVDVELWSIEDEMLYFGYQIDTQSEKSKDDRVVLQTSDESWERVIQVSSLSDSNGWVELEFPMPPQGSNVTMFYDKGEENEVIYIFKDRPLNTLITDSDALDKNIEEHYAVQE